MKKSLIAMAALAAAGDIAFASARESCDREGLHGRMLLATELNTQSSNMAGQVPTPGFMGQESLPLRAEITVTQFATNDVLEMINLPPGYKVVDWTVDVDDLDSNGTPTAVFKLGVLNAGKTDLSTGNAIWKTGLTTAQAGGVARMDTLTAMRAGALNSAQVVGIVVTTGSATFQAGVVGLTVWVAPK